MMTSSIKTALFDSVLNSPVILQEPTPVMSPIAADRWNVQKKKKEFEDEMSSFYKKEMSYLVNVRNTSNLQAVKTVFEIFEKMRWATPEWPSSAQRLVVKYCHMILDKTPAKDMKATEAQFRVWCERSHGRKFQGSVSEVKDAIEYLKSMYVDCYRKVETVKIEVKKKVELNVIKREGQLRWMMEKNTAQKDQYWSLWHLAAKGNIDDLRRFINISRRVAARNASEEPLTEEELTVMKYRMTIQLYMKKKCSFDIDERDADFHRTALHYAAKRGDVSIVRLLLGEGANVNAVEPDGRTPLHYAAAYGNRETVLELLGIGANKDQKDKYGCRAIDLADQNKNFPTFRTLHNWEALLDDRLHLNTTYDLGLGSRPTTKDSDAIKSPKPFDIDTNIGHEKNASTNHDIDNGDTSKACGGIDFQDWFAALPDGPDSRLGTEENKTGHRFLTSHGTGTNMDTLGSIEARAYLYNALTLSDGALDPTEMSTALRMSTQRFLQLEDDMRLFGATSQIDDMPAADKTAASARVLHLTGENNISMPENNNSSLNNNGIRMLSLTASPLADMRLCEKVSSLAFAEGYLQLGMRALHRRWDIAKQLGYISAMKTNSDEWHEKDGVSSDVMRASHNTPSTNTEVSLSLTTPDTRQNTTSAGVPDGEFSEPSRPFVLVADKWTVNAANANANATNSGSYGLPSEGGGGRAHLTSTNASTSDDVIRADQDVDIVHSDQHDFKVVHAETEVAADKTDGKSNTVPVTDASVRMGFAPIPEDTCDNNGNGGNGDNSDFEYDTKNIENRQQDEEEGREMHDSETRFESEQEPLVVHEGSSIDKECSDVLTNPDLQEDANANANTNANINTTATTDAPSSSVVVYERALSSNSALLKAKATKGSRPETRNADGTITPTATMKVTFQDYPNGPSECPSTDVPKNGNITGAEENTNIHAQVADKADTIEGKSTSTMSTPFERASRKQFNSFSVQNAVNVGLDLAERYVQLKREGYSAVILQECCDLLDKLLGAEYPLPEANSKADRRKDTNVTDGLHEIVNTGNTSMAAIQQNTIDATAMTTEKTRTKTNTNIEVSDISGVGDYQNAMEMIQFVSKAGIGVGRVEYERQKLQQRQHKIFVLEQERIARFNERPSDIDVLYGTIKANTEGSAFDAFRQTAHSLGGHDTSEDKFVHKGTQSVLLSTLVRRCEVLLIIHDLLIKSEHQQTSSSNAVSQARALRMKNTHDDSDEERGDKDEFVDPLLRVSSSRPESFPHIKNTKDPNTDTNIASTLMTDADTFLSGFRSREDILKLCKKIAIRAVATHFLIHCDDLHEPFTLCPVLVLLGNVYERLELPHQAHDIAEYAVAVASRDLGENHGETLKLGLNQLRLMIKACETAADFQKAGNDAMLLNRRIQELKVYDPVLGYILTKQCVELASLCRLLEEACVDRKRKIIWEYEQRVREDELMRKEAEAAAVFEEQRRKWRAPSSKSGAFRIVREIGESVFSHKKDFIEDRYTERNEYSREKTATNSSNLRHNTGNMPLIYSRENVSVSKSVGSTIDRGDDYGADTSGSASIPPSGPEIQTAKHSSSQPVSASRLVKSLRLPSRQKEREIAGEIAEERRSPFPLSEHNNDSRPSSTANTAGNRIDTTSKKYSGGLASSVSRPRSRGYSAETLTSYDQYGITIDPQGEDDKKCESKSQKITTTQVFLPPLSPGPYQYKQGREGRITRPVPNPIIAPELLHHSGFSLTEISTNHRGSTASANAGRNILGESFGMKSTGMFLGSDSADATYGKKRQSYADRVKEYREEIQDRYISKRREWIKGLRKGKTYY